MNSIWIGMIIFVVAILVVIAIGIWIAKKSLDENINKQLIIPSIRNGYNKLELDILSEINKARAYEGLKPLNTNDVVSISCEDVVRKLIRFGRMSDIEYIKRHEDLVEMLSIARIGEIVVKGHLNAESLVESLLRNTSHADILLGNFDVLGISAQKNHKGKSYICIVLIKIR